MPVPYAPSATAVGRSVGRWSRARAGAVLWHCVVLPPYLSLPPSVSLCSLLACAFVDCSWVVRYLLEHPQPISCLTVHTKAKLLATGQRGGPGFGGRGGSIFIFDLAASGARGTQPLRELSGFHSHGVAKVGRAAAELLSLNWLVCTYR